MMIRSFKGRDAEALFNDKPVRRWAQIAKRIQVRLKMLDDASALSDLAALGGNRLEALKGDRKGQHSIRVNDQWRICFVWRDGDADDVEVVDYH